MLGGTFSVCLKALEFDYMRNEVSSLDLYSFYNQTIKLCAENVIAQISHQSIKAKEKKKIIIYLLQARS